MSQSLPANTESTTLVEKIRRNKRLAIIVATGVLILLLWYPVIHPLLDIVNYSDKGEFAGQPVYYSKENRITRTLHKELEGCGFNDSDLDGFLRLPSGSLTQQFDANNKLIASIRKEELTTGVFEIKITCNSK